MIQIFNIHIDNNFKVTDGTVDNVQVGNVGIVTRHQVGNFAQTARFVAQNQFQAAGMSLVFGALAPRNVKPALRFIGKTLQRLAIDRM